MRNWTIKSAKKICADIYNCHNQKIFSAKELIKITLGDCGYCRYEYYENGCLIEDDWLIKEVECEPTCCEQVLSLVTELSANLSELFPKISLINVGIMNPDDFLDSVSINPPEFELADEAKVNKLRFNGDQFPTASAMAQGIADAIQGKPLVTWEQNTDQVIIFTIHTTTKPIIIDNTPTAAVLTGNLPFVLHSGSEESNTNIFSKLT